jgi:hypothetical protein
MHFWLKLGLNIEQFTRRRKCILLLPSALNRPKSTLFEWNGIGLLGYPSSYKHYANALQCYVILTSPILLMQNFAFFENPRRLEFVAGHRSFFNFIP